MRTRWSTNGSWCAEVVFRVFWLALVAVHVMPLVAVLGQCAATGATGALVGKGVGVLASMAFFGAKALGAPFLRVRCRWPGAVVFLAACSFVHQDVRDEIYSDPAVAITVAAVAAVAQAGRKRVWVGLAGTGCDSLVALLRARTWRMLVEPALIRRVLILERVSAVPRGPPVM
jgi:hypothetical protein